MALYRTKGIVLRSIRYGEADRILDLYTRERGLVSAIAKGIRRTKSRFGGRLEPLSCVDLLAYEGRTLDTVTQVEVLRSFRGVREDLARLEAAGAILSTVRALSGGDEADRRLFNLLYHALDALETREGGEARDNDAVASAFALKLCALAGYAPNLDACLQCGRDLDEAAEEELLHYAPDLGGALCAGCRSESRVGDAFPIPPATLGALRSLMACPLKSACLENGLGGAVRRVVSAHVAAHAPGNATLLTRLPASRLDPRSA